MNNFAHGVRPDKKTSVRKAASACKTTTAAFKYAAQETAVSAFTKGFNILFFGTLALGVMA